MLKIHNLASLVSQAYMAMMHKCLSVKVGDASYKVDITRLCKPEILFAVVARL